MSENSENKVFDWYKEVIELGKFEVQNTRIGFYETSKLHLSIVAGMLVLASYAITAKEPIILILAFMVSIFGVFNAVRWNGLINSSVNWEGRWYSTASEIEKSEQFIKKVGLDNIKAWSHEEVTSKLKPDEKSKGKTPKFYKSFVISLIAFYTVFAFGLCIYSYSKFIISLGT